MASGDYDCSYSVYMGTYDEVNEEWITGDTYGRVAAFYNPNTKSVYIADWKHYAHEWRHAFCDSDWDIHQIHHPYCLAPHFKIQR